MDRRALLARARRRAFVPLVAATAVLVFAWGSVDPTNCAPGSHGGDYCRTFGYQRELVLSAAAVPVAAAALALVVVAPASWTSRLPDIEFLQPCPRSLPLVVAVSAAYAPWLFLGALVASPWPWFLLAVPFAPFLGVFAALVAVLPDGLEPGLPVMLLVLLLLTVPQTVWYYAMGRGVDRAAGHVRNVVTSQRNS